LGGSWVARCSGGTCCFPEQFHAECKLVGIHNRPICALNPFKHLLYVRFRSAIRALLCNLSLKLTHYGREDSTREARLFLIHRLLPPWVSPSNSDANVLFRSGGPAAFYFLGG
jgi:hypothetical protein